MAISDIDLDQNDSKRILRLYIMYLRNKFILYLFHSLSYLYIDVICDFSHCQRDLKYNHE